MKMTVPEAFDVIVAESPGCLVALLVLGTLSVASIALVAFVVKFGILAFYWALT